MGEKKNHDNTIFFGLRGEMFLYNYKTTLYEEYLK
jgi:hypothetical protein